MRHRTAAAGRAPGSRDSTRVVHSLEDARDRDLVRRVVAGDEEAFRTLFRRHAPLAKGLAFRMVRQPFIAEEIVQEAFLALWRNPNAFQEDRGSFRAWLMSTVHHRAVDAVRREEAQRRRGREMDPGSMTESDVGQAVVDEADLKESRVKVRAALGEIPDNQRRVLVMMYFEGKTQTMIAAELGLPLGTVKSRTLLGMRRLRAMLLEAAG